LPVDDRTEGPAWRGAEKRGDEMLQGRCHRREAAWRRSDQLHQEMRIGRSAARGAGRGTEELITCTPTIIRQRARTLADQRLGLNLGWEWCAVQGSNL
jgi:hypothetical protein